MGGVWGWCGGWCGWSGVGVGGVGVVWVEWGCSLVPRLSREGEKKAWCTLFAHACYIYQNSGKIGYSCNLPCNRDV